jgi:hypothetical protein
MTYQLETSANDELSGLSHVQFLGYAGGWSEIGSDWDGSDGWISTFDTSSCQEGEVLNFYIRAFDWAGNWAGESAWDISLDFTHPDTTSNPLPNPNDTTAIHLKWTSTDNLAGIRNYHVRSSENGGDWVTEALDNASPEYWFVGNAGKEYTFRIRATDNAGNIEPYLEGAEVSTNIPSITSLCSTYDDWDQSALVNDNEYESSTPLNSEWQTHNFCNPTTADRLGDEDWFSFQVEKGQRYVVSVLPLHNSTMVTANLFASDGSTLLADAVPVTFGQSTTLNWLASQDGFIYLKLNHSDRRVAGSAVAYMVMVSNPLIYFPLINK